jgi:hypothetical protein
VRTAVNLVPTAIVAFLMTSITCGAQDSPQQFWGMGNTKCASYSEVFASVEPEEEARLTSVLFIWATGFMSGMNLLSEEGEIRDLSDSRVSPEALKAAVLGKCRETPESNLARIIASIYGDLPKGS